ncbi:hypothetical protein M413DRAFT_440740 [Hebeloma cylindrosporum]|uniref:Uncharacterized protein n=1 Tax=Hebeloma cylindrosporum TaxID=76867 RepID=A0A0C2Z246_HEBCY|nr:hypothetical protein M413DRAFT_440740 [Hebeloma cylindrosporum h7]
MAPRHMPTGFRSCSCYVGGCLSQARILAYEKQLLGHPRGGGGKPHAVQASLLSLRRLETLDVVQSLLNA